jgi:pyruvate dehydrogenase E2 component (dihydrolipoamide acetyltransferase)
MGARPSRPDAAASAGAPCEPGGQLERAGGGVMATPVEAPMVGKILQVLVNVGDTVSEDDTVIVMEAMKMEINVVAPAAGRVAEIKVAPGDAVETDQVVAVIE